MDDCLELESDPQMVIVARQFVRDRLASWEATDHLEAAVLVASELVTNAVLHARTAIQLRVTVDGPRLRIEVFDENSRLPVQAACPPDATSGRGLALVSTLATTWGIDNRGDGKVVWAELGPADVDTPDDCLDLSGVDTVEQAFERIDRDDPDTASR
ncbi:MAG TPA: ATP-binding protein [Acidimicrobiales bacterium]|nr:ATP-binding protein [Acidimicrobiales bacterium]